MSTLIRDVVLSPQELARRLVRSRNWHLYQAGEMRIRGMRMEIEVQAHEHEAQVCDELIRDLATGGGDAA